MQTNKLQRVKRKINRYRNVQNFKKHTWLDCSKLNQSESCLRALTNRQRRCIFKLLEFRLSLHIVATAQSGLINLFSFSTYTLS